MLQLTKMGYSDVAYELLLSRKFPSWFYMIEQGATTMWERWDGYVKGRGFQTVEMNSFNHYSIGAVGEWIYRVILGINFDEENPGYKHVILKPIPGGGLNWAKGHYESVHGKILSRWKIEGEKMTYELEIPANTTATVYLPVESVETTSESDKPIKESSDVEIAGFENGELIIKVGSGNYKFKSKYSR
jgi:alpha-L-rhamnosidase